MIKSKYTILSSVLVMSVFGTSNVIAAPSVKVLGTNTARIGANATAVKSSNNTSTTPTQRLGSIRTTSLASGTPLTVNKVPSKVNTADSGEESRLSLGKYIHSTVGAGSVKPTTGSGLNAGLSSSQLIELVERVQNLENSKQDTITAGDGLVKTGNTISLDSATLQDQVEGSVTDVLADDYYTAAEIDEKLDAIEDSVSVYPSITQQNVTYDSITVADKFDDDFDFTK